MLELLAFVTSNPDTLGVPLNVKVLKLDFYIKLLLDAYNFWIGWEQLPSVQ